MWTDRRLTELFKIEHPIVQSPMAGFATPELVAAVCEAGGLGSLGSATAPPDAAAKAIRALRQLTRRPINVNFFCHVPAKADAGRERAWRDHLAPYYRELEIEQKPLPRLDITPFGDAMCAVVEDTRPEVVSFHFGLPSAALLARVKAAGCRVMSSATTVEEAVWLEAHGADVVIAQGAEAGGHRGTFLGRDLNRAMASQCGTLALVPQIADAVRVPVIAAGGIADGRGIAAAFALGASGVQMGTAFLRCPEAATSPMHRDALKQMRDDETVLTNVFTGRPARVIASRLTRELGPLSDAAPDFPLPMGELPPLRAEAERQQRRDFSPLWSGQSARLATELPAKELVEKLAQDAIGRFAQLAGGKAV